MELMLTCFDKILGTLRMPIEVPVLGSLTVSVIQALNYLKEKHSTIHRDGEREIYLLCFIASFSKTIKHFGRLRRSNQTVRFRNFRPSSRQSGANSWRRLRRLSEPGAN